MKNIFSSLKDAMNLSQKMRTCNLCGTAKILESGFHRDVKGLEGRAVRCIDCRNSQARDGRNKKPVPEPQKVPKVKLEKKEAPKPKKILKIAPIPMPGRDDLKIEITDFNEVAYNDFNLPPPKIEIQDEQEEFLALEQQLKDKTSYHQTWDKLHQVYRLRIYSKDPKVDAQIHGENLIELFERALSIV